MRPGYALRALLVEPSVAYRGMGEEGRLAAMSCIEAMEEEVAGLMAALIHIATTDCDTLKPTHIQMAMGALNAVWESDDHPPIPSHPNPTPETS